MRLFEKLQLSRQADMLASLVFANLRKEATNDQERATMAELEKRFRRDFLSIGAVAWGKHYTYGEIKDLLAFYETPTGQKSIEAARMIEAEMMPLIQEWTVKTFQAIQADAEKHQ